MMVAVFIDGVDGSLARRCQVEEHAGEIDGRRLDDMVDYFTWVIVPVLALKQWGWVPPLVWCAPLLASALGMSHRQAKTDDDFFLGFPSLWNIVALYLWRWGLPPVINGGIVMVLSMMVLLPIRFVYPSKTATLRRLSMALMSCWMVLVLLSLCSEASWAQTCFWWSNLFPAYYLLLSLWLHSKMPGGQSHGS